MLSMNMHASSGKPYRSEKHEQGIDVGDWHHKLTWREAEKEHYQNLSLPFIEDTVLNSFTCCLGLILSTAP